MRDFIKDHKALVDKFLVEFLSQKEKEFAQINSFGPDVCQRLARSTPKGKTIRGVLVALSYHFFKEDLLPEVIRTGAAIELLQCAFLIHDDIMDRDLTRRGEPSFYAQYQEFARNDGLPDYKHAGVSLGLCAGDLALSLSYEILERRLIPFFSRVLNQVVLAQMADFYSGLSPKSVSETEILSLYKYKTASYTFVLPLVLGAILAKQEKKVLDGLTKIGELTGIIFQIRDDELGLFGDEKTLGKPVGSDIKENKKSLFSHYLFAKASQSDQEKLAKLFGKQDITPKEVEFVRNRLLFYQIPQILDQKVEKIERETSNLVNRLKINDHYRQIYLELLKFCSERQK